MRQYINLFTKKKQQQPIPVMAQRMRMYGIIFLLLSLVMLGVTIGYYIIMLDERSQVQERLERTQALLNPNDEIMGSIVYFINKKSQLDNYEQDDIEFPYYYRTLRDTLSQAETPITLKTMTLTRDRSTSFSIEFQDIASAKTLMAFIESDEFLNKFEALSMSSFSVGASLDESDFYTLRFSGRFKAEPGNQESVEDNETETES